MHFYVAPHLTLAVVALAMSAMYQHNGCAKQQTTACRGMQVHHVAVQIIGQVPADQLHAQNIVPSALGRRSAVTDAVAQRQRVAASTKTEESATTWHDHHRFQQQVSDLQV